MSATTLQPSEQIEREDYGDADTAPSQQPTTRHRRTGAARKIVPRGRPVEYGVPTMVSRPANTLRTLPTHLASLEPDYYIPIKYASAAAVRREIRNWCDSQPEDGWKFRFDVVARQASDGTTIVDVTRYPDRTRPTRPNPRRGMKRGGATINQQPTTEA